jgi:hypothetical protein
MLAYQKFPLLVLVDMGGTLFYKAEKKDTSLPGTFGVRFHIFCMRPGHKDFLLRLHRHPRIKLGFYSDMLGKNTTPVLEEILGLGLEELKNDLIVYD